ncbi:M-phase phosphoprotein 6-like [Lineus longissimus]|uniref:M-phase phosphoprotein 6-like n=1 Tax=Lineus longissimus TaxID=88925 RepID=UPI002B4CC55F
MATTTGKGDKKKLSKNLLLMKFMKRTAVKSELEEVQDEKRRIENEEHWELDIPELTKAEDNFIFEPSYNVLQNLQYGRMSFKGFNPEIERIMQSVNGSMELDEAERREKEVGVDDEEMSERYKWLVSNMGKKFATKRQRAEMQSDSDDDEDEVEPMHSEPKQHKTDSGHSENCNRREDEKHNSDNASTSNKTNNNIPQQKGSRKLLKKIPPGAGRKLVPDRGVNPSIPTPGEALMTPSTSVYNPQPRQEKIVAEKRHSGPVMDSDEEDTVGEMRRRRRRRKFIKPQD